jgi:hypothetical protein
LPNYPKAPKLIERRAAEQIHSSDTIESEKKEKIEMHQKTSRVFFTSASSF